MLTLATTCKYIFIRTQPLMVQKMSRTNRRQQWIIKWYRMPNSRFTATSLTWGRCAFRKCLPFSYFWSLRSRRHRGDNSFRKTMKIKTITVSHCIFKVWVVDYQTKQEHREPTDRTRNKINVFLWRKTVCALKHTSSITLHLQPAKHALSCSWRIYLRIINAMKCVIFTR